MLINKTMGRRRSGFTPIELMITIAILVCTSIGACVLVLVIIMSARNSRDIPNYRQMVETSFTETYPGITNVEINCRDWNSEPICSATGYLNGTVIHYTYRCKNGLFTDPSCI